VIAVPFSSAGTAGRPAGSASNFAPGISPSAKRPERFVKALLPQQASANSRPPSFKWPGCSSPPPPEVELPPAVYVQEFIY